jgi:hypothetical protein
MSGNLCAQLAALPPIEIAGLVVDFGPLFRSIESLALSLAASPGCLVTARGHSVNVVVGMCFAAGLEQHRERLGLSRDQVYTLSIAFAEVCEGVLGVRELAECQIGGVA